MTKIDNSVSHHSFSLSDTTIQIHSNVTLHYALPLPNISHMILVAL